MPPCLLGRIWLTSHCLETLELYLALLLISDPVRDLGCKFGCLLIALILFKTILTFCMHFCVVTFTSSFILRNAPLFTGLTLAYLMPVGVALKL
jgi:hypothetical protein